MSSTDPISDSIAKSLGSLIPGPAKDISDLVSDHIRYYRWKSLIAISEKAKEIRKEKGISDKEIPIKFLIPILEKGSMENEQSDLIDLWAQLLSGCDNESNSFDLICTELLHRLTSKEAKIIDCIAKHIGELGHNNFPGLIRDKIDKIVFSEGNTPLAKFGEDMLCVSEQGMELTNKMFKELLDENKFCFSNYYTQQGVIGESIVYRPVFVEKIYSFEESLLALREIGIVKSRKVFFYLKKGDGDPEGPFFDPNWKVIISENNMKGSNLFKEAVQFGSASINELTEYGLLFWKKFNPSIEEGAEER